MQFDLLLKCGLLAVTLGPWLVSGEASTSDLENDEDFRSLLSGGVVNASLTHDDVSNISAIVSNSSIFNNITHGGFIHGLGESISVILVSEIGDKTFFIAAILSMRNNKLTVFLAAVSALFLMTVLSGLLGWVVTTFIPREVTYYTCTAIMFLFGLKMLWEAWRMDENEAEEVQREVEQELARRGSISSRRDVESAGGQDDRDSSWWKPSQMMATARALPGQIRDTATALPGQVRDAAMAIPGQLHEVAVVKPREMYHSATERIQAMRSNSGERSATSAASAAARQEEEAVPGNQETGNQNQGFEGESQNTTVEVGEDNMRNDDIDGVTNQAAVINTSDIDATSVNDKPERNNAKMQRRQVSFLDSVIDRSCKENSWFGKKCLQMFKLFINTFSMTFIAEWGDRSQLATIVLVGINDVAGVIVGGCLGHFICTGGAVLAGAIIAKYVSVRKVTFIGALVFLGFAIASIFISPEEDGIEGIPEINGYDNTTRMINHNVSLTLALEHIKDEGGESMLESMQYDY